jgi:hypothetical protein
MSTARTRPIQHIDRKSLYTNLESRIRYLHSFLDFGASTCLFVYFVQG